MRTLAAATIGVIMFPAIALAVNPFGGPVQHIIFCYNQAIYTIVGAPRGGIYIWTPATRTYPFGAPSHTGQYLLGLYGAPYYCLVTIFPVHVEAGIAMTMLGSSGPSAGGPTPPPPAPPPPTAPTPSSPQPGMTEEEIEKSKKACESMPGCIWN